MHMYLRTHCVCHTSDNCNIVTARQASGEALPLATISQYHHKLSQDIAIQKNPSIRALWRMLFAVLSTVVWCVY